MTDVRMAIAGSGYMGRTYAESLTRYTEGAKLVAVALGTRAKKLAADYGAELEPDFKSLVNRRDVDAVLVATPHQAHAKEVIEAAENGKHVLVEKPMATSAADCDAMITACESANVTLSVIQTLRYRGVFLRAKELISQGSIGKVRMIQMTSLWDSYLPNKPWANEVESGGAILDRGSHSFDMLRLLTEDDPVSVDASVNSFSGGAWQALNGMAQVRFSKGAIAQLWMSHEIPKPGFGEDRDVLKIWGSEGLMEVQHFGKIRVLTGDQWREVWEQPTFNYITDPMNPSRLEAFYTQTQDFVDSLRFDRPPTVSGQDGRAAVEMVHAACLSSLTGSSVRLPMTRSRGGSQYDSATVPRRYIQGE